jgi:hypothetical protein
MVVIIYLGRTWCSPWLAENRSSRGTATPAAAEKKAEAATEKNIADTTTIHLVPGQIQQDNGGGGV